MALSSYLLLRPYSSGGGSLILHYRELEIALSIRLAIHPQPPQSFFRLPGQVFEQKPNYLPATDSSVTNLFVYGATIFRSTGMGKPASKCEYKVTHVQHPLTQKLGEDVLKSPATLNLRVHATWHFMCSSAYATPRQELAEAIGAESGTEYG